MPHIFISYRRSDSTAEAGRIYDYLENSFGRDSIFKDVNVIEPEDNFRDHIQTAVGQCQVLLAVIGKDWLHVKDSAGRRRLDNPSDWVRLEIETALNSNVRVIPVLLNGAAMLAPDELPEALKTLAYRNAVRVRYDPDFHSDMSRLTRSIQQLFKGTEDSTLLRQSSGNFAGGYSASLTFVVRLPLLVTTPNL